MTDISSKLLSARQRPRHLSELSRLLKRDVRAEELLSLEQTAAIRKAADTGERSPKWTAGLPFSDKLEPRFAKLIEQLGRSQPSPVYVWTPLSNECGLLPPVPLQAVDFGFDFALNPEGVFVLLSADLADKMLLDYSEDSQGSRVLELEVSGEHWGRHPY